MVPPNLPSIYLKPGEMVFCKEPSVVSTILGSCVSVTLFHRGLRIGAICHGLLPSCKCSDGCTHDCAEGTRYVHCSIHRMFNQFLDLGVNAREIEAKLFGGSDMFRTAVTRVGTINVGAQNIRSALSVLSGFGVVPAATDTGGTEGRKIFFITGTGDIFLKRVKRTLCEEVPSV
ncbi:MAG TPA: chemotaxis protein CheD [Dissulfurispiraceae bacterium]|nr:chemotaxis protein CheD [Dissulfurispiraceae bacterium]